MDIGYFLGEFILSLTTKRPLRRKRRSIAEIKASADEVFASTSPRAAARLAWEQVCDQLINLAARFGVEVDIRSPGAVIGQLQQLNIIDADFAGMLRSLGENFEASTEANLSEADAQNIRILANQFSSRLAAF